MVEPYTKACEKCSGTGLIPRAVAVLADHDYVRRYMDAMPFAGQEVCDRCGGSGRMPFKTSDVKE